MALEGRIANWIKHAPWLKIVLSLVLALVGLVLTRNSIGEVAIHWMYVYEYHEFTSWSFAGEFFRDLRTGISPFWALIDIFSYRTFGNLDLTDKLLYRGCMILMYVLPLWMFTRTQWQLLMVFLASLVCLWATVLIHPGNPQVYDVYLPTALLLLVKVLQTVKADDLHPRMRITLCFASGFLLSLIELTRPFVFLFMPIFLLAIWLMLRKFSKVNFAVFLVPILLLSGGWHAKMAIQHGQLNWTNHSGFNMYQSWNEFAGDFKFEEAPRHAGLSPNINTDRHFAKSKELTQLILKSWTKHPWGAIKHVGLRATQFFSPQTDLLLAKPSHWIFGAYRVVIWLLSLGITLALIGTLRRLLIARFKTFWHWLADPETLLLLFTAFNIAIFIVVEAREDARFMISVLPYMLSLPGLNNLRKAATRTSQDASRQNKESRT